jgi:hypothetical protein
MSHWNVEIWEDDSGHSPVKELMKAVKQEDKT